jgi:molybdopterin-containing oxidoreductase family iron-sulfur binding subunit
MEHKKYWQNFGQLNKTEAYEKSVQDEFKEPFASFGGS